MITLGVRPEEILQLKIRNIRRRDGLLCVFIGEDLDDVIKAEQSRRVLPVPQLLLDLGFREWAVAMHTKGEIWAFPEIEPGTVTGRRSQIFGDRMRTLLSRLDLKFSDEDIYAMRRTLSSKLLHLGVDTGVRQRVLGHLEGSTVDRHYSDDGLAELKALLDRVDYGVTVGRSPGIAFPVVTGCSRPLLPSLDVAVSLGDTGELLAVPLADPDTEEVAFAARIGSAPAPKEDGWDDVDALPSGDVADRLLALSASHSLTLASNEEQVAALEHLLMLGTPSQPAPGSVGETATAARQSTVFDVGQMAHPIPPPSGVSADIPVSMGLQVGDIVLCTLPLSRRGQQDATPRPGLVVGNRSLGGRRYLDVAWGAPAGAGGGAQHELSVSEVSDVAQARLTGPTLFDMRRRFLVAEDEETRLDRRLGTLSERTRKRIREVLLMAGDVTPTPIGKAAAQKAVPVVEIRAKKAYSIPARCS